MLGSFFGGFRSNRWRDYQTKKSSELTTITDSRAWVYDDGWRGTSGKRLLPDNSHRSVACKTNEFIFLTRTNQSSFRLRRAAERSN